MDPVGGVAARLYHRWTFSGWLPGRRPQGKLPQHICQHVHIQCAGVCAIARRAARRPAIDLRHARAADGRRRRARQRWPVGHRRGGQSPRHPERVGDRVGRRPEFRQPLRRPSDAVARGAQAAQRVGPFTHDRAGQSTSGERIEHYEPDARSIDRLAPSSSQWLLRCHRDRRRTAALQRNPVAQWQGSQWPVHQCHLCSTRRKNWRERERRGPRHPGPYRFQCLPESADPEPDRAHRH